MWQCLCMLSCFSRVWPCETVGTAVHQNPLSIGFSRQEQWSGLPCSPLEDLPSPGIEPLVLLGLLVLLPWQAGSLPLALPGKPHPVTAWLGGIWSNNWPILNYQFCSWIAENCFNFLTCVKWYTVLLGETPTQMFVFIAVSLGQWHWVGTWLLSEWITE